MTFRALAPGQRSSILLGGPHDDAPVLLFETDELLVEAPNWSLDGRTLLLNGNGRLWALPVDDPTAGLAPIEFHGLPELNNDHVLDPDGEHILLSAMDGHIYRGALTGGPVTKLTADDDRWHFLHGVSPDGTRIAYVELEGFEHPGRLAIAPAVEGGGPVTVLDTGDGHLDGPEWSPDGRWLFCNTEHFGTGPGHAQLARIPDGGGELEHLVVSDTVDWFPHLSPDARLASYIAFPAGTIGHPADLDVEVRLISTDDWATPLRRYPLFGGQGTLNVNSWSPDSSRFAFVAYPIDD